MKRLDQGNLHPLLEHPETNMSLPGIKPGSPASQASTWIYREHKLECMQSNKLSTAITRIALASDAP